jgi:hypothetical protein
MPDAPPVITAMALLKVLSCDGSDMLLSCTCIGYVLFE